MIRSYSKKIAKKNSRRLICPLFQIVYNWPKLAQKASQWPDCITFVWHSRIFMLQNNLCDWWYYCDGCLTFFRNLWKIQLWTRQEWHMREALLRSTLKKTDLLTLWQGNPRSLIVKTYFSSELQFRKKTSSQTWPWSKRFKSFLKSIINIVLILLMIYL